MLPARLAFLCLKGVLWVQQARSGLPGWVRTHRTLAGRQASAWHSVEVKAHCSDFELSRAELLSVVA